MRRFLLPLSFSACIAASASLADTIELADGTLLEGKFVGMSNGIMMDTTSTGATNMLRRTTPLLRRRQG